jgi:hypothetical protein
MNNKRLLRILGVLVIIAVALVLSKSVFIDNAPLSIEVQLTGPSVVAQNPVEGQRLDLSAPIEITFDRDMDALKTGDSFSFLSSDASTALSAVKGKITWPDARTFVFTPDTRLMPATLYRAVFSTQATAKDGTSPKENIEIEFKTMEALAVAQVFPAQDTQEVDLNTSVTVIFNHPVVPVTIKEEQSKLQLRLPGLV